MVDEERPITPQCPAGQLEIPRMPSKPARPFAQSATGEQPAWTIFRGDAQSILGQLDDESVDCMVTSPPYYWQRDYEAGAQELGKEPSIAGFVGAITDVMTEVRRVLKPCGTAWLNLGDSFYNAKGKPHGQDPKHKARMLARRQLRAVDGPGLGLPRKSLIGIPWRGWRLRSKKTVGRCAQTSSGIEGRLYRVALLFGDHCRDGHAPSFW